MCPVPHLIDNHEGFGDDSEDDKDDEEMRTMMITGYAQSDDNEKSSLRG